MSTKVKCLLLDDELPGLTYLRMLCEQLPDVEVVKTFNDPLKLIAEAGQLDFDLCILDIEMPGMSGLEVAQQVGGKPVIFTTAYKEYGAEAFDLEAVDYIRKPIQKDRLEKAISKAAAMISEARQERKFVQLNTNRGKALLYFDELLHVTTAENDKRDKEALLRGNQPVILKNISFDQLMLVLPEEQFSRISKKDIVALGAIRFFTHDEVVLAVPGQPDMRLPLSGNYKADFLKKAGP